MGDFSLNIKGQLNNMHLPESKSLWPVFEAIVNSIQAIEDSPNSKNGKIVVFALREKNGQQNLFEEETLDRFESFSITDNGIGMNAENYESFQTAYSDLKITKGCKGIGRFLWLKAFESVDVKSTFFEGGFYSRKFTFSSDGINSEETLPALAVSETGTTVTLNGFLDKYKNATPLELNTIAKKIIEHCLQFFVSERCPRIIITDGADTINLNDYFDANIRDSLCQDHFNIKGNEFEIYHLRVPEEASTHELRLCADMQEVTSVELKKYMPDLQKKIVPNDGSESFFYVGYVSSPYLNSIVNTERTSFAYAEDDGQTSLLETKDITKKDIVLAAIEFVKIYLKEYLDDICIKKRREIDAFVEYDRPTYRFLLKQRPDIYDSIPYGLKPEALDLELYKQTQKWELGVKQEGVALDEAAKCGDSVVYRDLFEKYWASVTDISKTHLAEYVTRRKTILTMLEKSLTIDLSKGGFPNEEVAHSIICPMRHTSDDIAFEEMNLWIVDERLAYHRYLASDKTLKSMPVLDSSSTKEPDIAIFDQVFAYSDSDEPFSSVTIIEFKKPGNDSKNPIEQVMEYVDLIREGGAKKSDGRSFHVNGGTVFRCYVICDLTKKMRAYCSNVCGLLPTADNSGYSGYNQILHSSIDVISYDKLLADAKKRNSILFDKLFAPKTGEILHLPA